MATRTQLAEAGLVDEYEQPARPWHPIQGPDDASTMWYSVLRKRERGVFIGTLCIRHTDRKDPPGGKAAGKRCRSRRSGR